MTPQITSTQVTQQVAIHSKKKIVIAASIVIFFIIYICANILFFFPLQSNKLTQPFRIVNNFVNLGARKNPTPLAPSILAQAFKASSLSLLSTSDWITDSSPSAGITYSYPPNLHSIASEQYGKTDIDFFSPEFPMQLLNNPNAFLAYQKSDAWEKMYKLEVTNLEIMTSKNAISNVYDLRLVMATDSSTYLKTMQTIVPEQTTMINGRTAYVITNQIKNTSVYQTIVVMDSPLKEEIILSTNSLAVLEQQQPFLFTFLHKLVFTQPVLTTGESNDLASDRNVQRKGDVNEYINSIDAYKSVHNNQVPSEISTSVKEISSSGADICKELSLPPVDVSLPIDPQIPSYTYLGVKDCSKPYDTGYTIMYNQQTGFVTVTAPLAELGQTISMSR